MSEFPHSIKAVIADLDGTIINTGNAMMTCLSRWVSAYGFEPPTYNQVMSVVHKLSLNEMLNAFLPDCRNRNFVDSIVAKIENSFADFYLPALASPISSAVESLTEFKKRGFSVAIVTNATRKMLYKSLKIFELKDVVDETVSANDVRRPKPDPSGIQQVLKRLGLEPQQAIFVGDTVTDMLAGRNAKVQSTVGVLSGIGNKKELQNAGAIMKNISDLTNFLCHIWQSLFMRIVSLTSSSRRNWRRLREREQASQERHLNMCLS